MRKSIIALNVLLFLSLFVFGQNQIQNKNFCYKIGNDNANYSATANEIPLHNDKVRFILSIDKSAKEVLKVPSLWYLTIACSESMLDSKAQNPKSSAVGAIQFTRQTCINLGTTREKVLRMSLAEQVPYCNTYFLRDIAQYGKYKSEVEMYIACFLPAKRKGYNGKDTYVLSRKGDAYFNGNKGLSSNNYSITVKDLKDRLAKKRQILYSVLKEHNIKLQ